MSTEHNKAVVRRFLDDVLNTHNLDAGDTLVAPDVREYLPGVPPLHGLSAFKDLGATYYRAFPDLQITVEDLIAEGDQVVARFTARGTHQGEFMRIPATGKQVTYTGITIYRVAAGKITEQRIEQDSLGLLQQLGVLPALG